jgi:hypothetical protein
VQFTIGKETEARLRRVQALLRREIPSGDPAVIFDRALALLLAEVERKKLGKLSRPARSGGVSAATPARRGPGSAATASPRLSGAPASSGSPSPSEPVRPSATTTAACVFISRHVPRPVRRVVWPREGEQCGFRSEAGVRCEERAFLELHHREPYALGGPASAANIALRCRRHNRYEADLVFGARSYPPRDG